MMQNATPQKTTSPVAMTTGGIVITAIVVLVILAFVFKGKVNF
jgi:hypothetical protein